VEQFPGLTHFDRNHWPLGRLKNCKTLVEDKIQVETLSSSNDSSAMMKHYKKYDKYENGHHV